VKLFGNKKKGAKERNEVYIPPKPPVEPPSEMYGEKVYLDENEWNERIHGFIDNLPWFGQDILPLPSGKARRKRGERLSGDDHQRVLLSWLAGGSAEQVARRAVVSRRSAYNVLRNLIYTSDPYDHMKEWNSLGLIACVVTPSFIGKRASFVWQEVVCLICHARVTTFDHMTDRMKVGQVFTPVPRNGMAWMNAERNAQLTQGHLVLHFWLDGDPMENGPLWANWKNTATRSLLQSLAAEYVDERSHRREWEVMPTIGGERSALEPWRRWRLRILEGKGKKIPSPP